MNNSITGYSDKISVAGGETIAFKVSARPARPYEARLVRIIHGDMNPAGRLQGSARAQQHRGAS